MIRFKKGEFDKKLELALAFIKSTEQDKERISDDIKKQSENKSYSSISR